MKAISARNCWQYFHVSEGSKVNLAFHLESLWVWTKTKYRYDVKEKGSGSANIFLSRTFKYLSCLQLSGPMRLSSWSVLSLPETGPQPHRSDPNTNVLPDLYGHWFLIHDTGFWLKLDGYLQINWSSDCLCWKWRFVTEFRKFRTVIWANVYFPSLFSGSINVTWKASHYEFAWSPSAF
jgi:hypothetical protein